MPQAMHSSRSGHCPGAGSVGPRVIVVFEDRAAFGTLMWLRAGFRHCFCLLRRPVGWIVCDPLKSHTQLDVIIPYDERDLVLHYLERKLMVLVGNCLSSGPTLNFLRPLTCVEIVKRIVGLCAPGVWTPYQLYRALRRLGFVAGLAAVEKGVDKVPR